MKIIGLTGASGAGKGTVAKIMSEKFGALHIDTDLTARKVVMKGKPCLEELKNAFGSGIIKKSGSLDRKKLASIAFSDKENRKKLNKITHFYINAEVKKIIEKAKKSGKTEYIVIDAPLLFESGEDKLCDVTLGIVSDKETRKKRIIKRDKIKALSAEKRINAGKKDGYYGKKCDYVLENRGETLEEFESKAEKFLEKMFSEISGK
ncbi:MAG: dephospho-CoA kinase [Clostridia bacterium]|nr:dephospho-CoA kinase [Clostridia bacterium]